MDPAQKAAKEAWERWKRAVEESEAARIQAGSLVDRLRAKGLTSGELSEHPEVLNAQDEILRAEDRVHHAFIEKERALREAQVGIVRIVDRTTYRLSKVARHSPRPTGTRIIVSEWRDYVRGTATPKGEPVQVGDFSPEEISQIAKLLKVDEATAQEWLDGLWP